MDRRVTVVLGVSRPTTALPRYQSGSLLLAYYLQVMSLDTAMEVSLLSTSATQSATTGQLPDFEASDDSTYGPSTKRGRLSVSPSQAEALPYAGTPVLITPTQPMLSAGGDPSAITNPSAIQSSARGDPSAIQTSARGDPSATTQGSQAPTTPATDLVKHKRAVAEGSPYGISPTKAQVKDKLHQTEDAIAVLRDELRQHNQYASQVHQVRNINLILY